MTSSSNAGIEDGPSLMAPCAVAADAKVAANQFQYAFDRRDSAGNPNWFLEGKRRPPGNGRLGEVKIHRASSATAWACAPAECGAIT